MNHQRSCRCAISYTNQSIEGVCFDESCSIGPYVCKQCIEQYHQGHCVVPFIYIQKMNKEIKVSAQNNTVSRAINKILAPGNMANDELANNINMLRSYYSQSCSNSLQQNSNCQKTNSGNHRMVEENKKEADVAIKNPASQNNDTKCEKPIEEQAQLKQGEIAKNQHSEQFNRALLPKKIVNQHQAASNLQEVKDHQVRPENNEQNKQEILKFNLFRYIDIEEQRLSKVILGETNECKINKVIFYIDVNKVTELTILNNATPCAINEASAKQISRMTNLKRLRIYWTIGLTAQLAMMMTRFMISLQELCLSQFNDCSQLFIKAIRNNNPNLKKITFTVDSKKFVHYNQENIEFITDPMSYFVPEKRWAQLSQENEDLSSLELNLPEHQKYWVGYVRFHGSTLKQLTLTANRGIEPESKNYKPQCQDYTWLMLALQKCRKLKSLRLQQIIFNRNSLVKVFQNNPKLLCLAASECPTINDSTYEQLFQSRPKLQELSIQLNYDFTATSLHYLTSLKTLVLRNCQGILQTSLTEAFNKLQQLTCLCLDYNTKWITGYTIQGLKLLRKLRVLNISNNDLRAEDIQSLKKIPFLNTLICTNNCFSYTDLLNSQFAKKLKKLSIGKNIRRFPASDTQSYEEIEMNQICCRFPLLSHLKLTGFKSIQPQFIDLMPKVICLTLVECEPQSVIQAREFCQQANIYLNC